MKHQQNEFPLKESSANARLIAAAPEMLEVLESILDDVYFEEDKGCYGISSNKLLRAKLVLDKIKETES